jgi:hypothetical protein
MESWKSRNTAEERRDKNREPEDEKQTSRNFKHEGREPMISQEMHAGTRHRAILTGLTCSHSGTTLQLFFGVDSSRKPRLIQPS